MDSALDDFQWLVSAEAAPLLDLARAQFSDGVNVVRIAKNLRNQTTASRSAIVMEQAQLRLRAKSKFSRSEDMFFTRRGLEQASSESLARYKAKRFAGVPVVADICCGVGGDLFGLLERHGAARTVGVDSDPVVALFARENCRRLKNHVHVDIQQRNFSSLAEADWLEWQGVHVDPDRRASERTVWGSRFSPTLPEVFSKVRPNLHLSIKVAPATAAGDDWPEELEREWIGDRRECKQQVLWMGGCRRHARARTATMVDQDQIVHLVGDEDSAQRTVEVSSKIKNFLYEPHPTVLAAGLIGELAATCGVARIASDIDYLTSTKRQQHPMMATFEVVECFPLNFKKAIDFLHSRSIGLIEVKNRGGAKLVYEKFLRLKLKGDHRATVILTRIGVQQWVVISRRSPTDFPN
jgi:SAM-dependent methyltransferase